MFIHLWDHLIVYSRLVPQNIWARAGENINQTLSFLQLAPLCLQLEDQYYEDLLFADSSFESVWCESDG